MQDIYMKRKRGQKNRKEDERNRKIEDKEGDERNRKQKTEQEEIKEGGWESPKWELGFWRISILYTFQASARARNTEIVMDNSGHNGRSAGGRDKHRDFSIYQFPETFRI